MEQQRVSVTITRSPDTGNADLLIIENTGFDPKRLNNFAYVEVPYAVRDDAPATATDSQYLIMNLANLDATTVIDWTDHKRALRTLMDAIDEHGMTDAVTEALRAKAREANDTALYDLVRKAIAEANYTDAVVVVFSADEWENGHFICDTGVVYDQTGREVGEIELPHHCRALNPDGGCGPSAGLGVDLRTGQVEFDDFIDNVFESFKISKP